MKKLLYENGTFTGERALYDTHNATIKNSIFEDGESPLKESSSLDIIDCSFRWKYPLWYCKDVKVTSSVLEETARSGIWYTNNIHFENSIIKAPKTFRRSKGIHLNNIDMPNALESFWGCEDIVLREMSAKGDYFCMNCKNVTVENSKLDGNYAFDGSENLTLRNCILNSKDSFWNCKNVVCENCTIIGEYLAWNSSNITFINCDIESNQGLCYMDNVTLVNCRFTKTDLCFERCSNVNAEINSYIDSVKNPYSGTIKAKEIGELILDEKIIDKSKVTIITEK